MSVRSVPVAAGIAALSLAGCTLLTPQIEVSRRFDRSTVAGNGGRIDCGPSAGSPRCYSATVSALSAPSQAPSLPLTALGDQAQAAYVAALAQSARSPAELSAALARPIRPGSGQSPFIDASEMELRFVVGIFPSGGYAAAGDRLAWARVRIDPIGPAGQAARFVGWSRAFNDFADVDVGSVTASRTEKLTAGTGLNVGGLLPDAKVEAELGTTREEKADIKDRVTIDAAISNGSGLVVQSGGWRRDLTGNAGFDATVAVSPRDTRLVSFAATVDTLSGPLGGWTPASRMEIGQRLVRVPIARPLCATVTLDFVVRHITRGERTFTESDDRVEFLRGSETTTQSVAPPVVTPQWLLAVPAEGGPRPLQFLGRDGREQLLQFPDKSGALDLLAWMRGTRTGGAIGNGKLYLRAGRPLSSGELASLEAIDPGAGENWTAANLPCPSAGPTGG